MVMTPTEPICINIKLTQHLLARANGNRRTIRRLSESILILLFIFSFSVIKSEGQINNVFADTAMHKQVLSGTDSDFTIVLFPDIQNMVDYAQPLWESMPKWVINNISNFNVKAVIGLGDNSNCADTNSSTNEFKEASKGWDLISSSHLPYVICTGNHDYDSSVTSCGQVGSREATRFNKFFGVNRYSGETWFGGAYHLSTQNYFITFPIQNQQYVILALEFFPRSSVLKWAQGILDSINNIHPDIKVILATHAYLKTDGSLFPHGSGSQAVYGPDTYGLKSGNSGEDLWNNFIKMNKNIGVVVSGHDPRPPYLKDTVTVNASGYNVVQMVSNFQDYKDSNGNDTWGNGYMVLLKFSPSKDSLYATTIDSTGRVYPTGATGEGSLTMPWPWTIITSENQLIENKDFFLSQNYPNPFYQSTTIGFDLKENATVNLDIFNVLEEKVQEYDLGQMKAGSHSSTVDLSNYKNGMYLYRLNAITSNGEKYTSMKQMILIK